MNKEAQEKIFERLRQDLINAPFLIAYADGIALAVYLVELGYRKLPKEKPPLIRIPKANEFIEEDAGAYVEGYGKGANAQREADIKWYGGNDEKVSLPIKADKNTYGGSLENE